MLDDLLTGAHLAVRLPGYLHRVIDFDRGPAVVSSMFLSPAGRGLLSAMAR